jgi:hypothetical protein
MRKRIVDYIAFNSWLYWEDALLFALKCFFGGLLVKIAWRLL